MLAKLATRKHTVVLCNVGSFLGRLLGNILLKDSPPSVGKGLVYWLLPVFVSLSLAIVCSTGSYSPTLLGCVTQPLWESAEKSNPLPHSIKLSLGPDVVGGTRISTGLVELGLGLRLHSLMGILEAMPKLVLLLTEFEIAGGIRR